MPQECSFTITIKYFEKTEYFSGKTYAYVPGIINLQVNGELISHIKYHSNKSNLIAKCCESPFHQFV